MSLRNRILIGSLVKYAAFSKSMKISPFFPHVFQSFSRFGSLRPPIFWESERPRGSNLCVFGRFDRIAMRDPKVKTLRSRVCWHPSELLVRVRCQSHIGC